MSPILGSLGAAAAKGFRALGTAFSNFLDNFNRTTSGSLGTPSGGTGTWLATSGTWNANGTVGTSATAASSYPIASVEMGTPNITINLDVDTNNGAGAAFWVSDAQNWWGVVPWQATSVTYSQACSTYGQSGATYACNAYAINAYTQVCNSSTQNSSQVCNSSTQNSAQVCNSSTQNSSQVCNSSTTNYFAYCAAGQVTNWTQVCNSQGVTYSSTCNTFTKGYDGFRGIYFSICNAWGQTTTYNCNAYGFAIAGYSCSGGTYTQGTTNICNAYGTAYGSTCNQYGTSYGSTCNQYGTAYGSTCNAYGQGGGTQYCATQSGPTYSQICNVYFSQTNNNPGTRYLRLLKSVANTVTTVLDQSVSATIASIKVIVSNGTITGRAYSATGQTTQTGTDLTNTPVSPTTGTKHGIILAPGGYTQGSTVDNLSILLP